MKILKSAFSLIKGNPVVAIFAAVSVVMESTSFVLGGSHTVKEQVAYISPLVVAFISQYTTVPWAEVKPLVEEAAKVTGAAQPQYKDYATAIEEAIRATPVAPGNLPGV